MIERIGVLRGGDAEDANEADTLTLSASRAF
jgi:hypothetical protein